MPAHDIETTARIFVCKVDDMEDGDTRTVVADPPIAVFRVRNDFFATSDSCTHEQWSLGEDGELEGHEVVCTLHMARFDVRTGAALCFPALVALERYRTEVDGDDLFVHSVVAKAVQEEQS